MEKARAVEVISTLYIWYNHKTSTTQLTRELIERKCLDTWVWLCAKSKKRKTFLKMKLVVKFSFDIDKFILVLILYKRIFII